MTTHPARPTTPSGGRAVPRTPVEEPESWRARAGRWELFSATLHHHHHGEDLWLWPLLLERADPSERREERAFRHLEA